MSAVMKPSGAEADPILGRILDPDGHLYMEPEVMKDLLRELLPHGGGFVLDFLERFAGSEEDKKLRARNRDNILAIKGISALGSFNPSERAEALETVGIRSQIVFSNTVKLETRQNTDEARVVCRRVNDYALDWQKKTRGRARVACQINQGNVEWAYEELERVLKAGALAVDLPCAQPPGGVSPAHETWDRFWAMLQEANVPALIHLGDGGLPYSKAPGDPMLPQQGWGDAAALRLKPAERSGGEEAVSPYYMLVAHIPAEVYLQVMVMGGVFERFPRLRFGILEFSTTWLGLACERMDTWSEFLAKVGKKYELKPSEFVRRNVRVGPFPTENLPLLVERHGLKEVYCFSTDYGHLEGSRDPIGKFRGMTDKIGAGYEEDFFVKNPSLLFPGLK